MHHIPERLSRQCTIDHHCLNLVYGIMNQTNISAAYIIILLLIFGHFIYLSYYNVILNFSFWNFCFCSWAFLFCSTIFSIDILLRYKKQSNGMSSEPLDSAISWYDSATKVVCSTILLESFITYQLVIDIRKKMWVIWSWWT